MITCRTRTLPDGTQSDGEFVFLIEDDHGPSTLRIPGEHHGPDVCIADSPEQESWLNSRPDLVIQTWDCEWRFVSEEAARRFVELIAASNPLR